MSLTAKKPESNYECVSAGTYQAVCYQVIDLGTQYNERFKKTDHKCLVAWEVPSIRVEFTTDKGKEINRPRAAYREYTMSTHEKANLTKDLASWRGKPFTAEEQEAFSVKDLLGANCLLQFVEHPDDPTKTKIAVVMKLMKGMPKLEPENDIVYYDMDEHGDVIPTGVYEWVAKKIQESEEFKNDNVGVETGDNAYPEELGDGRSEHPMDDDDIPF